jgi:hypothetical protein
MHFWLNLLRIKGLYMFRSSLAHPQEAQTTALGTLRACYVSWQHQDWSARSTKYQITLDHQPVHWQYYLAMHRTNIDVAIVG